MAGVKGKSGGARKGTGGARAGAGRKKSAITVESTKGPILLSGCDMLTLLQDIALGRVDASPNQVRAAIAAVQYTYLKKGEGGKKDEQVDAAKQVMKGRFAPGKPPTLATVTNIAGKHTTE